MKKNTSTLKKIFGYIGHYKYLLLLSVLLAGGSVVLPANWRPPMI